MELLILGLVENMSYVPCPDCGKHNQAFGESHIDEVAIQYHLPVLAKLPIYHTIARMVDRGAIEQFQGDWLDLTADIIQNHSARKDR